MSNWYTIQNAADIDSPAMLVYPSRVAENIRTMVGMVDDPGRLRPHIKTHKTAEGIRMMMDAGVRKFKCATIREAELLGETGALDNLLAYQPHGPKLNRFMDIIMRYPQSQFACLVDNAASAAAMSESFSKRGLRVSVYIDLNIGMNRTGIIPGDLIATDNSMIALDDPKTAAGLYAYCTSLPGIKPVGLHAYDGHQRNPDITQRTADTDRDFEAVLSLQQFLLDKGFEKPIIVAGGSPSFAVHSRRKDRECSPGTCIFWDKGYSDICPEQAFIPAVALISRVVSLPTPTRICLDLGHKAVAAENEITRRVYFPDAPELIPVGQSEEHLVMETSAGHGYKPGDLLYGIPFHVCPTVAMYNELLVVRDGVCAGSWKVAARMR